MSGNGTDNARNIEIAEYCDIMRTRGGRNVMCKIIEQSGYFSDSFDPDPYVHASNAGRRRNGLFIVNELQEATPGEFNLMLKERQDG